jgi:hypothetical protein
MICTAQLISHEGVPRQTVTEDAHYQQLFKGKQIFYIVSTRLDGPAVSKFGIAHDAARRGWNIQRLRQYLEMFGAERHDHSQKQKQSQKKQSQKKQSQKKQANATELACISWRRLPTRRPPARWSRTATSTARWCGWRIT